jgi:D-3-phosphoglycerate dehydrogenase
MKMVAYINTGTSLGSVNLPEVSLPKSPNTHRIINLHQNVSGVLRSVNAALADFNVVAQVLMTKGTVGYLLVDVDKAASKDVKQKISEMKANIKTRILY